MILGLSGIVLCVRTNIASGPFLLMILIIMINVDDIQTSLGSIYTCENTLIAFESSAA